MANASSFMVQAGMLEEVANTSIPRSKGGEPILAYSAWPQSTEAPELRGTDVAKQIPILILIHEFWGLAPEMCSKASALAKELECLVVAPDTYRGESTRFIPKAIYLALSTPQDLVNADLDEVVAWAAAQPGVDSSRLAVMGFCYGGGKAVRYSIHHGQMAATVVVYGRPVVEVDELRRITGPVLGIFGDRDSQFSPKLVREFEVALGLAKVEGRVSLYPGQGHAFWTDMSQVAEGPGPQRQAWEEVTAFLGDAFNRPR